MIQTRRVRRTTNPVRHFRLCQLFQENLEQFLLFLSLTRNLLKKCSCKLRKLQIANNDPPVRVDVKLDIQTRFHGLWSVSAGYLIGGERAA